jgi:O-antigen ligase
MQKFKWVAGAGIFAGAFLLFVFLPPDAFFERFTNASEQEIATLGGRITHAEGALPLVNKYAAFGCGLGGFESAFFSIKHIFPRQAVKFVHNDWLQGLVELGVLGFGIVAILIASALYSAVRARHLACIGAITAILLHSMVDFNLYVAANAMTLSWICGIAMAQKRGDSANANIVQPDSAGKPIGNSAGGSSKNFKTEQRRLGYLDGLRQLSPIGAPRDLFCGH